MGGAAARVPRGRMDGLKALRCRNLTGTKAAECRCRDTCRWRSPRPTAGEAECWYRRTRSRCRHQSRRRSSGTPGSRCSAPARPLEIPGEVHSAADACLDDAVSQELHVVPARGEAHACGQALRPAIRYVFDDIRAVVRVVAAGRAGASASVLALVSARAGVGVGVGVGAGVAADAQKN